ncbi:4Fe-4S dicluster domain-containing protein [Carboxydothermus hydrogenoformans]|uniref:Putative dehydrogenase, beta subunit n=1 Tax=Carboxydothermus hydrogenoformans (strain ATCC BAA-161 / DSM 6008 / Z-2901) TaxID=246194 RepID=Q3ADK5_CARHZ|nr:4Fe-4S dicluster domain-containing protein [Carboxydothermus hydrogenoformans]ABB16225.1 putative dehydrogenase, beta subunit [Carboxydothermus hydrogenoformans Z-2901]
MLKEKIKSTVTELLENKQVDFVIGYGAGSDAGTVRPAFVKSVEEVEQLIWSPFAVNNLAKFVMDHLYENIKIGVIVKGCDSRSVIRLVQDKVFPRENFYVIGIPCKGILDKNKVAKDFDLSGDLVDFTEQGDEVIVKTSKGEFKLRKEDYLLDKCYRCETPTPVVYDVLLGEEVAPFRTDDYEDVKAIENLSVEEKSRYWDKQFEKCIRCYACRNVCSACNCRDCVFDMAEPNWVGKAANLSENTAFHLIRAWHVAGRCVDCGECSRVCPMGIPVNTLNRKMIKDMKELFAVETPGKNPEQGPVLGTFKTDDPEEFM